VRLGWGDHFPVAALIAQVIRARDEFEKLGIEASANDIMPEQPSA